MYLGMLLVLTGFALWRDSWLALLSPLAFFLYMNQVVIPREERMVESRFAEQFQRYRQRTRRWL
jgi:protein-S-isoprenylcysteine O-methyltransferase Ste14